MTMSGEDVVLEWMQRYGKIALAYAHQRNLAVRIDTALAEQAAQHAEEVAGLRRDATLDWNDMQAERDHARERCTALEGALRNVLWWSLDPAVYGVGCMVCHASADTLVNLRHTEDCVIAKVRALLPPPVAKEETRP